MGAFDVPLHDARSGPLAIGYGVAASRIGQVAAVDCASRIALFCGGIFLLCGTLQPCVGNSLTDLLQRVRWGLGY